MNPKIISTIIGVLLFFSSVFGAWYNSKHAIAMTEERLQKTNEELIEVKREVKEAIKDGQETIDFFFGNKKLSHRKKNTQYLLLLDIKMPKVNGIDVLQRIKLDKELCKMPVIIITTTDDPKEIENCYRMGCSYYVTKPVDYNQFVKAIRQLGLFLRVAEIPELNYSFG